MPPMLDAAIQRCISVVEALKVQLKDWSIAADLWVFRFHHPFQYVLLLAIHALLLLLLRALVPEPLLPFCSVVYGLAFIFYIFLSRPCFLELQPPLQPEPQPSLQASASRRPCPPTRHSPQSLLRNADTEVEPLPEYDQVEPGPPGYQELFYLDRDAEFGHLLWGQPRWRAAMIRDELLGNDSAASDTEPLSDSSTSKSEGEAESRTTKTMDSSFSDTDLEDRLSCSGIAHSLRHIALAFDEKSRELDSLRSIQQRHDEEIAILQDRLKTAEQEQTARTMELQLSNSSREDMEREIDALKQRLEEKDELLFVSDRVLHRLFNMIRVIKTQVDEAESLSPAVRSSDEEAPSSEAAVDDPDEGDVTRIETTLPTFKSQAEEEIDKIVRDIAERYGKASLDEEA